MAVHPPVGNITPHQQDQVKRKELAKLLRGAVQYAAVALLLVFAVRALLFSGRYQEDAAQPLPSGTGGAYTASSAGDGGSFIAIGYAGLTTLRETNLVYQGDYEEQLDALKLNGFQTISQEQTLRYVRDGAALPQRAMTLLFEDGIADTAHLAQSALRRNNYLATVNTYGLNLSDKASRYLTTADVQALTRSSYWELGCGGWRLSYINVFDRWGNSFGPLNMSEYLQVRPYLRRDYNHYLMDFLRDEDRMRLESESQMSARIRADYEAIRAAFVSAFGSVPSVSVLMHANTRMFATDPLVSVQNEQQLTALFPLNYNRMGSCYNDRAASPYDLTRMQIMPWWSVNCMLMHILDDTGLPVTFLSGDAQDDWETLSGAVQLKEGQLILTSETLGAGRLLLRRERPADLTLTTTLKGTVYGRQAIYLRSDRTGTKGICVAVDGGELVVTEDGEERYRKTLLELDGGPFQSEEENELEGLVAWCRAVQTYDEDPVRKADAGERLQTLLRLRARTIAEGAKPYIPDIDVADRGTRRLEIVLSGSTLTVKLDERTVIEDMPLRTSGGGQVLLEAAPRVPDEYSQRNVYEDVYDARFQDLKLVDGSGSVLCDHTPQRTEQTLRDVKHLWEVVVDFVMEHF